MADPSAQAPKRVHLHPLQLQAGPPLWLLNAPGVSGVYVKGAEAQYGVEFLARLRRARPPFPLRGTWEHRAEQEGGEI